MATYHVEDVDNEVRGRYSRRADTVAHFLQEWIRLDESQEKLFGARGDNRETYFQATLAKDDVEMGLALAEMCSFFAESTSADKIIAYLNVTDSGENDIWHYLAELLARNESPEALEVAHVLIKLEVDYCRKNTDDESALSKLLLPEVKWLSINSMNKVKALTIEEIEQSLPDTITANEPMKQEIVNGVFISDLDNNGGHFTTLNVHRAAASSADMALKQHTMKVMFEYLGGSKRESVFMHLVEGADQRLFDACLNLLLSVAEARTGDLAARDVNLARARQQVYMFHRLARPNRGQQTSLSKAVIKGNGKFVSGILGMFKNETLVELKKNDMGKTVQEEIVVSKQSPAPANPALSFLLMQDNRGNTVFHTAALLSRVDCLRKLFTGLSMMDSYMIVARIPNNFGVTVKDLLDYNTVIKKLQRAIKNGRAKQNEAKQMAAMAKRLDRDVKGFLDEMTKRSEDVIERTGGLSEAKPTFDLKRIPSVVDHLQRRGSF